MVAVIPHLTVVAGWPGSGKTRHLLGLKEDGSIQRHLEDHLEGLLDLERNLRLLKLSLQGGCRIGICGRSFRESYRRILLQRGLEDVPGLEIDWIFFEPNPKACLENIIKDGLVGMGSAKERVLGVLGVAETPGFDPPRDATILPVVGRDVDEHDLSRFFRKYDFGPARAKVERKIRRHLRPDPGG